MRINDTENMQKILTERYEGEWKANIVEGTLPEGEHLAYQSGYELKIGDVTAKLDHGIRGMNCPHNARVVGDEVFLSYVK